MSVFHEVKLVPGSVDKLAKAPAGMRNVVLTWRKPKGKANKLSPDRYLVIPDLKGKDIGLSEDESIEGKYILALVKEAQKAIIVKVISERITEDKDKASMLVNEELISIDSLAKEYFAERQGSAKIKTSDIEAWFESEMADVVEAMVIISKGFDPEKLTDENQVVISTVRGKYKEHFLKFASPAFMVAVPLAKKLVETLECEGLDKEHRVWIMLHKRIKAMTVELDADTLGL